MSNESYNNKLEKLITVVSNVAMGDLSKEIEVTGEDEFAALGIAINEMIGNLKHYRSEMAEKILAVVSDIAMGDLSKEIEVTGEDEFAALGMAINEMIYHLRQMHKKLLRLSEIDELTNIPNRRKLFSRLALDIERSKRYSFPLTIAMMDLDHFKKVNDVYGHIAGDHVLKKTANILRDNIRKADILGRYGGEEFVIIMVGLDIKQAEIMCEKLRKEIEKYRYPEVGQVTISIGLTMFCEKETSEQLIAKADQMLYLAKEHGRNRLEVDKYQLHNS